MNRREFIQAMGVSALASTALNVSAADTNSPLGSLIVPKANALPITGTFLDEISHDIPHQNWGAREWDADFAYMKAVGIDTVIMIRCGHKQYMTWPSETLKKRGCLMPSVDLLDLFLRLAEKHGMKFFFGLYDPGLDIHSITECAEVNMPLIEEVWQKYGHYSAFKGWYLSSEFSRNRNGAPEAVRRMGRQCKDMKDLPTLISPWIDGKKAVHAFSSSLEKKNGISVDDHEKNWDDIFSVCGDVVDICAFQDGHIGFDELDAFFTVNKRICQRHNIQCWTNAENFDRDMPIKFLPIKFDKLRWKLEAAKRCGMDKAITFEFSHFMSPQSMYPSAAHLYNRYREYFGL